MKNAILTNIILFTMLVAAVSACAVKTANTANTNVTTISVNLDSNVNATPEPTPESAAGRSQAAGAEALVADLYKQHDAKKSPFFQTKNRSLVDKYFTKPTADLIWKDATSSGNEVGALDGDPLYATQDADIKNFAVGKADVKGATATVPVTFTNYDKKNTVKFQLKMVGTEWKIDDIIWPEGDSMVKVIKDNYSTKTESDAAGEFEGKFQVGETSCTVKPVKMAFEVRWEKGSGVEMFFAKEGNAFESSPDKGPTNRFEFDGENYTTGTFYRADGKSFPVKRVK